MLLLVFRNFYKLCFRKVRFTIIYKKVPIRQKAGTEELAHMEMVCAIVRQLTRNLSIEEINEAGFAPYYVDHGPGIWPQSAGGVPFS